MRQINFEQEIHDTFMEYTLATLTERSIPSIYDGLLDVHRKLLFTLEDVLKMTSKSKTRKSASIIGSCLASVYTHGDAAAYESLCKLSQDFLMRYPLVTPQGSMGTLEANGLFGASRYTEAKPSIFADLMFNDYKKEVVDKRLSYNGEYMQPNTLPSLLPNAIVNGRESIATGLSHTSLPNNLSETCDAIIAQIEGKINNVDDLMQYMKGFDFPRGGTIINANDIKEAYATGKSKVSLKVRGDYEIKGNKIIFTSIPYKTYRKKIREQIAKNIEELEKVICDFKDASALGKTEIIFEVVSGVDTSKALNALWKYTDLQTSLSLNMNFLVNGAPKMCSMLDLVKAYVDHQDNIVVRATEFDKKKAADRLHIVEGLVVAVASIDKIISLIRNAEDRGAAAKSLASNFPTLSEIQIKAILDMRLASLTKLDGVKLEDEKKELTNKIIEFNEILSSQEKRNNILIDKILDMKKKYGDERRTKLENIDIVKEKKAIPAEDCIVTLYADGTLKRSKKAARKGRNTLVTTPIKTIKANTMDEIFIFTNAGKVYKEEISNIPEDKRLAAKAICEAIGKEKPIYILLPDEDQENKSVCFFTKKGMYKKTLLSEYTSLKRAKKGAVAIKLKPEDELREILILDEADMVTLVTKNGFSLKIPNSDVNAIGRNCAGVIGIKLNDGDELASASRIEEQMAIVLKDGHVKKFSSVKIPQQGRGTKGKCISEKGIYKILPLKDSETLCVYGLKEQNLVKGENLTDRFSKQLNNDVVMDVLVLD